MKFLRILAVILLLPTWVQAKPTVSGDFLTQFKADRVLTTQKSGVSPNNAYVYIESNANLNFNKNWSIKTNWRLQPNKTLTTRDSNNPERYRTFLSDTRGFDPQDSGLIAEEIKLDFKNDDMEFYLGKFDPTFGTAYNKKKRIGVFTAEFAEDYNLREKLGSGIAANLENSKITFNTFFNDTTGLSNSAVDHRGRANRSNGISGNTGTLSSYSVAIDGDTLFGIEDLYYNAGYRSLGVDNIATKKRETAYVVGAEYLYRIGYKTSIIPFFEGVKINNFGGFENRNAVYTTAAVIGKYSAWTASVSSLTRNIQNNPAGTANQRQLQLSIGYKFTDNISLDVSRSKLRENGYSGALVGAVLTYFYKF